MSTLGKITDDFVTDTSEVQGGGGLPPKQIHKITISVTRIDMEWTIGVVDKRRRKEICVCLSHPIPSTAAARMLSCANLFTQFSMHPPRVMDRPDSIND